MNDPDFNKWIKSLRGQYIQSKLDNFQMAGVCSHTPTQVFQHWIGNHKLMVAAIALAFLKEGDTSDVSDMIFIYDNTYPERAGELACFDMWSEPRGIFSLDSPLIYVIIVILMQHIEENDYDLCSL